MRKLILAGVLLYVFLVARDFPADVVAGWFVPEPVKVYGVSGSVWSGSAEAIDPGQAGSGLTLGATSWTISPLWLLTARLRGTLSTQFDEGSRLNTAFSKPLIGKTLKLSKAQGILDLAALPEPMRPNQVVGRVGLSFESLTLDAMWPVGADGTVDLVNLNLTRPTSVELGSFEVVFSDADDSEITGIVADTDSEIEVEGTLSIKPDRSYFFTGSALAGPDADSNVARSLPFLGIPDDSGRVALTYEGTIE
ncbi:MAG: type II secretion system protein N [Gammaproteobacteria bacterium]